jgi:hypothetical protein
MYMNLGITAFVIAVCFVVLKLGLYYKETKTPNLKDGMIAFVSSMAGLYAVDMYAKKIEKTVEVFTNAPAF